MTHIQNHILIRKPGVFSEILRLFFKPYDFQKVSLRRLDNGLPWFMASDNLQGMVLAYESCLLECVSPRPAPLMKDPFRNTAATSAFVLDGYITDTSNIPHEIKGRSKVLFNASGGYFHTEEEPCRAITFLKYLDLGIDGSMTAVWT